MGRGGKAEPKPVRIVDETVLARARARDCEWPGCSSSYLVHAAHIKSRGSGGDDVDENVVSLCAAHHAQHHSGQISSEQLREIVRQRREREQQFFIRDDLSSDAH